MEDLFALVIPRGLLKRRKPPRVSLADPTPEDLEQIEELRIQGSRLKVPHPVRAFVRFEDEKSAREAMDFFAKEGFRCSIQADARGAVRGPVGIRGEIPYPRRRAGGPGGRGRDRRPRPGPAPGGAVRGRP